jgi:hypothetical protein
MQQLNPTLPPVPAPADLAALGALVKFVGEMIANPKEARKLVDAYMAGAAEYQQAYERELGLRRQVVAEKAEFEARLIRDRKDLDAALEAERNQVAKEHAQRRQQIEADERAARDLLARAKVDADAAAALRKQWESKFAKLSALAAA